MRGLVGLLAAALIAASVLQAVFFKRVGYALGPYPYFVLLSVSFCFVPLLFGTLGFIVAVSGGFVREASSPWLFARLMAMGGLNGLNGMLVINANPHVSGVMQTLLAQLIIPVTLALSVALTGARFSRRQVAGAGVILLGLAVAFSRDLLVPAGAATTAQPPLWCLAFALGQVPSALGSIYQEMALRNRKVNVVIMMAASALGQFLFFIVALPAQFLPGFGSSTPATFGADMRDAAKCTVNLLPGHPECGEAAGLLAGCVLTMLLSNVLQTYLVKAASAATVVLVLTLVTPATVIAFSVPALAGAGHQEALGYSTWLSLALLLWGVYLYRTGDVLASATAVGEQTGLLQAGAGGAAEGERPVILASRVGFINSEFTDGAAQDGQSGQAIGKELLFQYTRARSASLG